MKPKAVVKLAVDAAMTVLLLLLMAFELVGRAAHEWIGVGMFFLFVLHHLLNRGWTKRLFQGKYTPYRVAQTGVAALVFLAMLGSFASAVFISQEVFAFLPIRQGMALGRTVHLLCAYWGYLLLSLHLGLHWGMMVAMAGKSSLPLPGGGWCSTFWERQQPCTGCSPCSSGRSPPISFWQAICQGGFFSFRDKICPPHWITIAIRQLFPIGSHVQNVGQCLVGRVLMRKGGRLDKICALQIRRRRANRRAK